MNSAISNRLRTDDLRRARPSAAQASAASQTAAPWSVDRWGRLIAGASVLFFTFLAIAHHPYWIAGTLGAAANLVLTSLTDRCLLRDTLLRLGAKEREDLFLPGGVLRPADPDHGIDALAERE